MKMTINTQFARVAVELTPEDAGELMLMAVRMATPKPPMSPELRERMMKLYKEDASAEESGGVTEERLPEPANEAGADDDRKASEKPNEVAEWKDDSGKPSRRRAACDDAEAGFKGFLYVRCAGCGTDRGVCIKTPISNYRCGCGGETSLEDLIPMPVRCRCCGKLFRYKTNVRDQRITVNCHGCGAPVDLELHGRKDEYITL